MTTTNLDQKRRWLDVLAILHYVYGGFLVAMLVVGVVFVTIVFGFAGVADEAPLGVFVPVAMASVGLLLGLAMGVANLFAGRWLRERRNWVGALVVSGINCLNVPLGTLLGVFTIVVLAADDGQALFEQRPSPPPAQPVVPAPQAPSP